MKYNFKKIHIGKLISSLVEYKKIDDNRIFNFFENQNMDLEVIFNSESLNTDELLKWSKLLHYDLFRVYSQHLMLYNSINISKLTNDVKINKSVIPSFKKNIYTVEIIEFVLSLINSNKMTISEVITNYGIPKTTLHRWIKKYNS